MDKKILLKKILEYFYKGQEIPDNLNEMRKMYKKIIESIDDYDIPEDILLAEDKYLRLDLLNKKLVDGEKFNTINTNLDEKYIHGDKIALLEGDIGNVYADSIINPVDDSFDNNMFLNAGLRLRKKCLDILKDKKLSPTEILITRAYNLLSDYIIHVVLPKTDDLDEYKKELGMCYFNVLECSNNNIAKTIVLSDINKNKKISKEESMRVLIDSIINYLDKDNCTIEKIIIVTPDSDEFDDYTAILENYKETTE